ncbi:MAG: radical SAM protein [Ardenticatenaceae bacterium]|nr:radical SAM protein [Ardenticatenaceae bacterium]
MSLPTGNPPAGGHRPTEAGYVTLHRRGDLKGRVEAALMELGDCRICPRDCEVDRLQDERGVCHTGRLAKVASYFPHFGEEDCLRGWKGSGTIFFAMCNLRCVFCQNADISHMREVGQEVTPLRLASMMLELQEMGCHNINWVTPEHVVPQALEALLVAAEAGLTLPIVYNTSAYDSLRSLELLDGVVDIYMPDFKIWDEQLSFRYLKARDYPAAARRSLKEMYRQVGSLQLDQNGLARRGLLVRHLVMPGLVADSGRIMRFLAEEISPDTYVNIMDQYYPAAKVSDRYYSEINRRIHGHEYLQVVQHARTAGLHRFDTRG